MLILYGQGVELWASCSTSRTTADAPIAPYLPSPLRRTRGVSVAHVCVCRLSATRLCVCKYFAVASCRWWIEIRTDYIGRRQSPVPSTRCTLISSVAILLLGRVKPLVSDLRAPQHSTHSIISISTHYTLFIRYALGQSRAIDACEIIRTKCSTN